MVFPRGSAVRDRGQRWPEHSATVLLRAPSEDAAVWRTRAPHRLPRPVAVLCGRPARESSQCFPFLLPRPPLAEPAASCSRPSLLSASRACSRGARPLPRSRRAPPPAPPHRLRVSWLRCPRRSRPRPRKATRRRRLRRTHSTCSASSPSPRVTSGRSSTVKVRSARAGRTRTATAATHATMLSPHP
ncbi:hypothetical protein ACFPRL_18305 [Pseudoclavibacter helvolus]